ARPDPPPRLPTQDLRRCWPPARPAPPPPAGRPPPPRPAPRPEPAPACAADPSASGVRPARPVPACGSRTRPQERARAHALPPPARRDTPPAPRVRAPLSRTPGTAPPPSTLRASARRVRRWRLRPDAGRGAPPPACPEAAATPL